MSIDIAELGVVAAKPAVVLTLVRRTGPHTDQECSDPVFPNCDPKVGGIPRKPLHLYDVDGTDGRYGGLIDAQDLLQIVSPHVAYRKFQFGIHFLRILRHRRHSIQSISTRPPDLATLLA